MTDRATAIRNRRSSSSGGWVLWRPSCAMARTPRKARAPARTLARPLRTGSRSDLAFGEIVHAGYFGRHRSDGAECVVARTARAKRRVIGATIKHFDQADGDPNG